MAQSNVTTFKVSDVKLQSGEGEGHPEGKSALDVLGGIFASRVGAQNPLLFKAMSHVESIDAKKKLVNGVTTELVENMVEKLGGVKEFLKCKFTVVDGNTIDAYKYEISDAELMETAEKEMKVLMNQGNTGNFQPGNV